MVGQLGSSCFQTTRPYSLKTSGLVCPPNRLLMPFSTRGLSCDDSFAQKRKKVHVSGFLACRRRWTERRERVSQLVWCGGGCFDSRRCVNSAVLYLLPSEVKRRRDENHQHTSYIVFPSDSCNHWY